MERLISRGRVDLVGPGVEHGLAVEVVGSVSFRASWVPDWWPARPRIGFGLVERGPGAWHGLRRLRLRRHLGAAGPHGAGLPALPLPRLWAAVQRAQRRPAEP